MALADQFDGFLIDLDGVVWIGREPVPGAAETLRALVEARKRLIFVTNNPSSPPARYAEFLQRMGVEVEADQVVTAGMVAARLAGEAGGVDGSAFVIGGPVLKEMVAAAGLRVREEDMLEEASVVVVSGHADFGFGELRTATRVLRHGAALIATSRDPTLPMPGGPWPGTGAVLAAVETASGCTAEIAGKPERHLFEMALEAVGDDLRMAMIGDRIASDIVGAQQLGMDTVLVLSGAASREEAATADPPPGDVIDNLAGLLL